MDDDDDDEGYPLWLRKPPNIGDIIMITKGWLYLALGMAMNVAEQY